MTRLDENAIQELTYILFVQAVIQQVRPHYGQRTVAERLRSLLHSRVHPSEIAGKSVFPLHFYMTYQKSM